MKELVKVTKTEIQVAGPERPQVYLTVHANAEIPSSISLASLPPVGGASQSQLYIRGLLTYFKSLVRYKSLAGIGTRWQGIRQ